MASDYIAVEIESFPTADDAEGQTGPTGKVTVLVDPDTFSKNLANCFDRTRAMGESGALAKYAGSGPEKYEMEVLFDATGIVADGVTAEQMQAAMKAFTATVYTLNGKLHQPNFLKVTFGGNSVVARASRLKFETSLCDEKGRPVRAKAVLSMIEAEDSATAKLRANLNSPDITHRILVKAGDTLPAISQAVYGSTEHYLDLARANGLCDFRRLKAGTEIHCPPLSKTS
jgi:hypothetical protein